MCGVRLRFVVPFPCLACVVCCGRLVLGEDFFCCIVSGCVSVALRKVWFRPAKPYLSQDETIPFVWQEHTFDMLDDGVRQWGEVLVCCRMGFFEWWRDVCGFFCDGAWNGKSVATPVCRQCVATLVWCVCVACVEVLRTWGSLSAWRSLVDARAKDGCSHAHEVAPTLHGNGVVVAHSP